MSDNQAKLLKFKRSWNNNEPLATPIKVSNTDISDEVANALAEALKRNTSVSDIEINLKMNNISERGWKMLAGALETNTTVTTICSYLNRISDEGWNELAAALKMNKGLTSIKFIRSGLGDAGADALAEALKVNKTLTKIDLKNNMIGDKVAMALGEALERNTGLTDINLDDNKIGDAGAEALAKALKKNATLTIINLNENNIGNAGAKAFAEALKTNTTLTSIELGNTNPNPNPNPMDVEYEKEIIDFADLIKDLTRRNKVFNLHKTMIDKHSESFYIDTKKDKYEWSSETSREAPVWDTDVGDGKVFGLLLDVLSRQFQGDGSEKKKLKLLVETKTNSKGSSLLHLAVGKNAPEALKLCKFLVEDIEVDFDLNLKDSVRRTAKEIATASLNLDMSSWARSHGTFLGFDVERVLHVSNTAIVLAVTNSNDSTLPNGIVLKAMKNSNEVLSELEGRDLLGTKDARENFIVDVLRLYVDESEVDGNRIDFEKLKNAATALDIDMVVSENFTEDLVLKVKEKQPDRKKVISVYKFLLVLERADRTLSDAILHDHFIGEDFPLIRKIAADIAEALLHFHYRNIIHADLKPLNIVCVGTKWQLIDMDVSREVGEEFGRKLPSWGYCPPEMAKVRLDETKLSKYKASFTYDLWSFGVVLFHLVKGELLWNEIQNVDISIKDQKKLAAWNDVEIRKAIYMRKSKLSANHEIAFDLISKLLGSSEEKRKNNFKCMVDVLKHPFFHSKGLNDATLKEVNKDLKKLNGKVDRLIVIGEGLRPQLQRMQNVLLTGMIEANDVRVPTSCIILPHRLDNDAFKNVTKECEKYLIGAGAKESELPDSKFRDMTVWFNNMFKVGDKLQDEEYFDAGVEALQIAAGVKAKTFYLYLIDDVTGDTVTSNDANSKFPIEITEPAKWLTKLMPLMKTGLKVMSITKGLLKVGQCFFPPLILASELTSTIHKKTKTVVGALDQESSIAEFDSLSEILQEAGNPSGATKEHQRGAALREFAIFLKDHDVVKDYCGLERTVITEGDRAGTVVWTLLKDKESMKKALDKNTKERKERKERKREIYLISRIEDLQEQVEDLQEQVKALKNKLRLNKNKDEDSKKRLKTKEANIDSLQKELKKLNAAVGNN